MNILTRGRVIRHALAIALTLSLSCGEQTPDKQQRGAFIDVSRPSYPWPEPVAADSMTCDDENIVCRFYGEDGDKVTLCKKGLAQIGMGLTHGQLNGDRWELLAAPSALLGPILATPPMTITPGRTVNVRVYYRIFWQGALRKDSVHPRLMKLVNVSVLFDEFPGRMGQAGTGIDVSDLPEFIKTNLPGPDEPQIYAAHNLSGPEGVVNLSDVTNRSSHEITNLRLVIHDLEDATMLKIDRVEMDFL